MKKIYILFIILSVLTEVYGQNNIVTDTAVSFTFEEELDGDTIYEYTASDYIKMNDGFKYTPNSGNYFHAKTNPLMVFPPGGGVTGGAPNNNENGVVGTIPGSLSVSPTGAAIYTIPIDLPPGINGMTPELALVYNSQGGNGNLGLSWNLHGLSMIQRMPADMYHDNFIDCIDLEEDDKLALDGNRLIVVGSGTDPIEYRTEIENFSKIEGFNITNSFPNYFIVKEKNGLIKEYGNTNNSRIEAQGKTHVIYWLINSVVDRYGNTVSYSYIENNGEGYFYLDEINYGGITGSCNNKIKFYYTIGRDDENRSYIRDKESTIGPMQKMKILLDSIEVKFGSNLFRKYRFTYNYEFYNKLTEVNLEGLNHTKFNPTKFVWGSNGNQIDYIDTDYYEDKDYFFGDYNGDGKTDYVLFPEIVSSSDNTWKMYCSNGDGSFTYFNSGVISLQFQYPENVKSTYPCQSYDFNGDGHDDIFWAERVWEDGLHQFKYHFKWTDPQSNFFEPFPIAADDWPTFPIEINHEIFIGDFTGNGSQDALFYFTIAQVCTLYQFNTSNNATFTTQNISFGDKIHVIDFDGDGKKDIIGFNLSGCNVFSFKDDTFQGLNEGLGYPTSHPDNIYFGDFNGDNKSDVITWSIEWGWGLNLNNGHSFYSENLAPSMLQPSSGSILRISDLNNDGKDDILFMIPHYEGIVATESYVNAYYFNGKSFELLTVVFPSPILNNSVIKMVDFNGDGGKDVFYNDNLGDESTKIISLFSDNDPYQIKQIINGLGNTININYGLLSDNTLYDRYWISPISLNEHVFCFSGPLKVVKDYDLENGLGGFNKTEYHYGGLIVHKRGKGMLCFKSIKETNMQQNSKNEMLSDFGLTYFFPYVSEINQKEGNKPIIKQKNLYKIHHFDNNRIFPYLNKSLIHTFENDLLYPNYFVNTIKVENTYDSDDIIYGNISQHKVLSSEQELEIDSNDDDFDFKTETNISYLPANEQDWLINRLNTKNIIKEKYNGTYNNDNVFTHFQYDNNNPWQLESIRTTPNNQLLFSIKKTFNTYDGYGNITKITTEPFSPKYGDEPTLVTNFEYQTTGNYNAKFLTKITRLRDGITYEDNFEYNPVTGLKTKNIDMNDMETSYYYDDFGRLTKTIFPDDNIAVNVLRWSDNHPDEPSNSIFYSWSKQSGSHPSITFFDKLGRDLRSVKIGFNGQKIYEENTYNDLGLVNKIYEPFFKNTGQGNYIEYQYGERNRVKQKILPTYTIEYTYKGLTTITKNLSTGVEITKVINALGQTETITDPTGTISYDYYSSGNVESVTAAGGETTMLYDLANNQRTLSEPNSGITTYDYDSYGRLREQTDYNSNTTNLQYDELARITNKEIIAGSGNSADNVNVSYSYITDNTINGFGQLENITGQNNITYQFFYDNLERIVQEDETIEGQIYSSNITYDIFGRTKKQTYPTGYQTVNYYNANGYFGKTKEAGSNKTLRKIIDINQRWQITDYMLGNGQYTARGYNNYGFPASIVTGSGLIQGLSFDFDPTTGNLNWREDNTNGLSLHENFTYDTDKLHTRLTGWGEDNQTNYNIQYNDDGNIDYKTDITCNLTDSYQYNSSKPHAVTEIHNIKQEYLVVVENNDQDIQYNAFQKISSIEQGDKKLEFTYGPDEARKIMKYYEYENNNWTLKKSKLYILGNYEIETDEELSETRELLYIGGFAIKEHKSTGENNTYYLYSDYQGNLQTITDETGTIIKRYSFDPWGRHRNPDTWQNLTYDETLNEDFIFDRGYTGHEHLEIFGLINMNGRLYDPWTGRMLSPDNFVQTPGYLQNYNRYSYALNNPLVYTDPNGEIIWTPIIIGAVIGTYMGGTIANEGEINPVDWDYSSGNTWSYMGAGAVIGGLSGGAAGGISAAGGGAMAAGAASGVVGGAGFSGLATGWNGEAMLQGAVYGGISGAVGGGIGASIGGGWGAGALAGGASSNLTGQLLYSGGDMSSVNWASVAGSGALSLGMYHGMSYASWKWGGGNKMFDTELKYSTFCKINADYQRSRFSGVERGGFIMNDGTYQRFNKEQLANYGINDIEVPDNAKAMIHTHWDKPGKTINLTNKGNRIWDNSNYTGIGYESTTTRYHSFPNDFGWPVDSFVINRYDASWSPMGSMVSYPFSDPFIRFFLFPW
ncbi:MAG: FG-GAP-like repeat-containing protein [Bacteroidales bacterium]|nr:FG-GAP-like repeat-containing protein [Bacteroidales bacterium]